MGIFRAVTSAVGSSLEVQWKELFTCDALPDDVLLCRGYKRVSDRSANDNPEDDAITHGSVILIAEGQCAIVVSGGRVIASCMTPGEYTFEDPDHASGIKSLFRETGRRIAFGGDAPSPRGVQRVYYLNTRESMDNPFSGSLPLSLTGGGGELTASMTCRGVFSYRIQDPALFYRLITGNVSGAYNRSRLAGQITSELGRQMGPAAAALSRQGLRPSALPGYAEALCAQLRTQMNQGWMGSHGLEMVSVGLSVLEPGSLSDIGTLQAQSARREAVSAPVRNLIREQLTGTGGAALADAIRGGTREPAAWTCACGAVSAGKFCPECGAPRPWVCACAQRNKGRFCTACGRPRPTDK